MQAVSLPQTQKVQIAVVGGATLKSRRKHDCGGKFWQTYQITNPAHKKEQMPLVSGKSSGTCFHLVTLDYDVLAPGFTSYAQMAELFDNPACTVTVSPSGKLKVFVSIKWYNASPNTEEVLEAVKRDICPPELWTALDKKSLFYFYLTSDAAEALQDVSLGCYLDWSKLGKDIHSSIVSDSSKTKESQTFSYKIAETEVPETYSKFVAKANRGWQARELFVKILIASFSLNKGSGWGLSQQSIATQLNVSEGAVNAWFKHFQETGWLKKVNNKYIVGLQAIKYVAGFELVKDIANYKETQKVHNVRQLPKKFPNKGEFHKYFLSLSRRCGNWDEFKKALDALPGMNYKRYKHALSIFNCDVRRRNKKG